MKPLSAAELLNVWERGLTQHPIQRSLLLLTAACPDLSPEQLANLSIGQRDSRLLTLREWMFGPQLVSVATCPKCSDRLELNFTVAEICAPANPEPATVLSLQVADYNIQFRLPNSLDLFTVDDQVEVMEVRQHLLNRCLLSIQHQEKSQSLAQLPESVLNAVLEHMARLDPQADVQLSLVCPACAHPWWVTFDVVPFFWSEIHAWASRILREVHLLASAYGWCEADILGMSPQRRQMYLEMISG